MHHKFTYLAELRDEAGKTRCHQVTSYSKRSAWRKAAIYALREGLYLYDLIRTDGRATQWTYSTPGSSRPRR